MRDIRTLKKKRGGGTYHSQVLDFSIRLVIVFQLKRIMLGKPKKGVSFSFNQATVLGSNEGKLVLVHKLGLCLIYLMDNLSQTPSILYPIQSLSKSIL